MTALRVCSVDELSIGEVKLIEIDGVRICVAHCADGFRAVSDWCSHEKYSLSEGDFDPELCEIECPQHGSLFSLVNGEPSTLPATEPVAVYDVAVEGSDVMVVIS